VGYDKSGKIFVSLIEGKKYPFYGVQWHPEMSKITQTMLISYVKDVKKSKKKIMKDKIEMKEKVDKTECVKYSNGLYDKCMIYKNDGGNK
jgi:hypothetical protein